MAHLAAGRPGTLGPGQKPDMCCPEAQASREGLTWELNGSGLKVQHESQGRGALRREHQGEDGRRRREVGHHDEAALQPCGGGLQGDGGVAEVSNDSLEGDCAAAGLPCSDLYPAQFTAIKPLMTCYKICKIIMFIYMHSKSENSCWKLAKNCVFQPWKKA